MILKFVIAGISIQYESDYPLAFSNFDSGFLSDSDKNPEFFISLSLVDYREPENQKCLFRYDDLIVTADRNGNEIRYFMFPETQKIYGYSFFEDERHIRAFVFEDIAGLESIGIPFWNFFMLDQIVFHKKGLILHSSYIMDDGEAILFSAPSGVGKSTQASLWNKYHDSKIVNGDRSLLMEQDGCWMANGFPFHGSSEYCTNESYPIRAIIVLRQDLSNHIKPLSAYEKFNCIMSEVVCNRWNRSFVTDTMGVVEKLISEIPVYMYYCNMEQDAVTCLHNFLEEQTTMK